MLAGPYEFLVDNPFKYGGGGEPAPEEAKLALAAYKLLHVDAGWLSARAAAWLKKAAGGIPPRFAEMRAKPVSRTIDTVIGPVGVVLFPEGPAPGKGPGPGQEEAVLAAAKALQKTCVMVVGISPWGSVAERAFLPKAQGVFTCLLGGGEGVAFSSSSVNTAPGVIWSRPDPQGRAVNMIEFYTLPQKNGAFTAKEGVSFASHLQFLDASCPSLPSMQRLIGDPPR